MSSLTTIATALPSHRYDADRLLTESRQWLADSPQHREKFERFVRSAKTENRYFALPVAEILALRGLSNRAELFESIAPTLAERSLGAALRQAGCPPESLGTLVSTSCSCPLIPSIDGLLVERLGLNPAIDRTPIYQYGCAGGVAGLALASRLAERGATVALTAVELCTLVFHFDDLTAGHLVGAAIFGDGSATAILTPGDGGLTVAAAQSYLLPRTRHLMGYDLHDDGSHLRLAKELPETLHETLPAVVQKFLAGQDLVPGAVDWWLFHPGGIRILESLERTFCPDRDRCRWSREVLREVGNLSSATVLFVLDRFLRDAPFSKGDHVMLVGIGPGLTIELVLFQVR